MKYEVVIKVGTVLIAKDKCEMKRNASGDALVVGEEYPINYVDARNLAVESKIDKNHLFSLESDAHEYWGKYFDIKKPLC